MRPDAPAPWAVCETVVTPPTRSPVAGSTPKRRYATAADASPDRSMIGPRSVRAAGWITTNGPIEEEPCRAPLCIATLVDAWERRDARAIVALLTDDATFSMPPNAVWYQGRDAIATFLTTAPLQARWRLVPIVASTQLAFACYDLDGPDWTAHSIDVLTLRGDRVEQITAFLQPELVGRFGLPPRQPARSAPATRG